MYAFFFFLRIKTPTMGMVVSKRNPYGPLNKGRYIDVRGPLTKQAFPCKQQSTPATKCEITSETPFIAEQRHEYRSAGFVALTRESNFLSANTYAAKCAFTLAVRSHHIPLV